jgi:hypothetical protein
MRQKKPLISLAAALIAAVPAVSAYATDWLQFGYDTAHSGYNREETGYSTPTGNTILYHYSVPATAGTVDSTPVYLGNVATNSGVRNLLFALSNNGTVLALDADSTTLDVVWSHQPTGGGKVTSGFGSPAIDPGLQYVYVYAFDGKIHKYQVADGAEVTSGGWPEVSTLKPEVEKGASGLSIATAHDGVTRLYSVTDGYVGDANDYQGHITAINLGTGAQNVFNSECSNKTIHFCNSDVMSCATATNDCSSRRNGIWGRPGAVYDAGTDLVFIMTGNGPFNVNPGSGIYNWGDSVLALNPDGTGAGGGMPVDSYTPTTYANIESKDADLGSASIAIVPPPPGTAAAYQHIAVAAGKDGCVRLIDLSNLNGSGVPAGIGGELELQDFPGGGSCATGNNASDIKPQPAVWVNPADQSSWVYIATYSHGLAAYKITLNAGTPSLAAQWPASGTAASGTSPVVANGTLYYMSNSHLLALDAVTGTSKLSSGAWVTTANSGQHWQSPIVVNGRMYLFDHAAPSHLRAYQLDGSFKSGFE